MNLGPRTGALITTRVFTARARLFTACLFTACLLVPAAASAQSPQSDCGRAQPAPGQQWVPGLQHRNARYARVDRCLDEAGDAHERLVHLAVTERDRDVIGDREERRVALAAGQIPPRASRLAAVTRESDGEDAHEAILAGLPNSREHAELRRLRDFTGDMDEVREYQEFLVRHGDPVPAYFAMRRLRDQVRIATHERDLEVLRYRDGREEIIHGHDRSDLPTLRDRERSEERSRERLLDRDLVGSDREFPGLEAALERDAERALEQDEATLERDRERADARTEKDLEKQGEREAAKDEKRQEAADERSKERLQERQADRQLEQQLERQEVAGGTTTGK